MAPCPSTEQLLRLQDGQLAAAEHGALETHVEACLACQQALDRLPVLTTGPLLPLLESASPSTVADHARSVHADVAPPPPPSNFPAVPGYDILAELGHGGMGVVYKARHLALRRLVALKMILARKAEGPVRLMALAARFQKEAEAAARLQHPNLVQIYEIGACAAGPYIAMEYVEGTTLARALGGSPRNPRQAARLVEALARAIHTAHRQNIVHRDLKPANVLLQREPHGAPPVGLGIPKIADFGLAKQLDDEALQTQPGVILGTPSYMAPEQAQGASAAASPLVDVYALGAVLYECLTGRPPFKAETALDTLEQVRTQEPVPVTRLQPKVPHDLETICLKCLQKEPHRRYESAEALADDLGRFLDNRPILARPAGRTERAWRWARRNPRIAGLSAAVLLLLTAVAVISTWAAADLAAANARAEETAGKEREARAKADRIAEQEKKTARKEEKARGEAEQARGKAEEEKMRAVTAAEQEKKARLGEAFARKQEQEARKKEQEARRLAERRLARLTVGQALPRLDGDPFAALPYLAAGLALEEKDAEPDPRHRLRLGAVLRHLPRLTQLWAHNGVVGHVAFSPDGGRVLATCWDGTASLWDADSGDLLAQISGHRGPVMHGAFSPDGRHVATGGDDGTARVWDAFTGATVGKPLVLRLPVASVAFSPSGRHLLGGGGNRNLGMQTRTTPGVTHTIPGPMRMIPGPPGPNGRPGPPIMIPGPPIVIPGAPLTTIDNPHGRAQLWEVDTGKPVGKVMSHPGWLNAAAFSPDGRLVVTVSGRSEGGRGEARLWDLEKGEPLHAPLKHRFHVQAAAFAPDGKLLATASGKASGGPGEARIFDVASGEALTPALTHARQVVAVVFAPAGRRLLTASADGTARVWDVVTGAPLGSPLRHAEPLTAAAFSPDGRHVLTAGRDRTARLWDAATGEPAGPILRHASPVTAAAFSAEGHRVVTACRDGTVRVWELVRAAPAPLPHPSAVTFAVFSADGRRVLTGSGRHEISTFSAGARERVSEALRTTSAWLWDAATGQSVSGRLPHDAALPGLALSPDDRQMLTTGKDEGGKARVWLWDAATGKLSRSWEVPAGVSILGTAFGPDGRPHAFGLTELKASAKKKGSRGTWLVRVLDGATGQPRGDPLPHPAPVHAAALAPDGRRLATVAADRKLRLWDVQTGRLVTAAEQGYAIAGVLFSPDGRRAVTYVPARPGFSGDSPGEEIDREGNAVVTLWDLVERRKEVLKHPGAVTHVGFSVDGRRVVTAGADNAARVWDAATGAAAGPPLEHRGRVNHAAFSRDGRSLVTAGEDRTARVWDVATGEPLTPPLPHPDAVLFASFDAAGRRLVTAGRDGQARFWDLPAEGRPAADVVRLAEALSGHRLDRAGGLAPLAPAALRDTWEALRAKYPRDLAPAARPDVLAWHRLEAQDCEAAGQWFAAARHLDRLIDAAPKDWGPRLQRAGAYLRHEQWEKAAADAGRAVALGADRTPAWHVLALAQLGRGDTAGYRRTCAGLRERFGRSEDADTARDLLRTCLLGAGAVAEGEGRWLVELARKSPRPAALGAALYRTGAWEEAVRALQDGKGRLENQFLLAMAHYRLGQADKAREWLGRANATLERLARIEEEGGTGPRFLPSVVQQYSRRGGTATRYQEVPVGGLAWELRLELDLLRREARALIEAPK